MNENQTLKNAVAAIKSGDKVTGQKLLLSLLKTDPKNQNALLWLSATINDADKKRQCIERVLQINPDNETAKRELAKLGQKAQSPKVPKTKNSDIETESDSSVEAASKPLKSLKSKSTKKCPYCAEIIKAEAVFCRFCGKDLGTEANKQAISPKKGEPSTTANVSKKKKTGSNSLALIITALVFVILCCSLGLFGNLVANQTSTSNQTPSSSTQTPGPPSTPTPDIGSESGAEVMCQKFVTDRLKAPSSAEFGGLFDDRDKAVFVDAENADQFVVDMSNLHNSGVWVVTGDVDAQNSFGAMLRSEYACVLDYDKNTEIWYLLDISIESP